MTWVSGGLSSCGSTNPVGFRPSNSSFLVAKLVLAALHFDIIYLNIVNNQLSCRVLSLFQTSLFLAFSCLFKHLTIQVTLIQPKPRQRGELRGPFFGTTLFLGVLTNKAFTFSGPPRTGYPLTPVHHTCASSASRPAKS